MPTPAGSCGSSTPCPAIPRRASRTTAMEMAAKTWTGEWWKLGGGGTVWDSITYDRELDLLYVGTGNGSPVARGASQPGRRRQPVPVLGRRARRDDRRVPLALPGSARRGLGLHLHAVDRARRRCRSTGRSARCCMHAPKNGFFYVLDRATGKLLSAKNFVPVNWAIARRPRDRQARRESRGALRRRSGAGHARPGRRAQLVSDGVQPADAARLFSRLRTLVRLRAGSGFPPRSPSAPTAAGVATPARRCRGGWTCRRKATRARRPAWSPGIP